MIPIDMTRPDSNSQASQGGRARAFCPVALPTPGLNQMLGVAGGRFLALDVADLGPRRSAVYQAPGGALILARSAGQPSGDTLELLVADDAQGLRAQLGDVADAADLSAIERAAEVLEGSR